MPGGTLTLVSRAKRGVPVKPVLNKFKTVYTQRYRKKRSKYTTPKKPTEKAVYTLSVQRQRGPLPFAKVFHIKTPWCWDSDITTPATTLAGSLFYKLNDMNDPDIAVGGHQPMQWDQLTGIYKAYIVHACKVELEFNNPNSDSMYVGFNLYHSDSNVQAANKSLYHIMEMSRTRVKSIVDSGEQKQKFSFTVPIWKLMGIPKATYLADRANYGALTTSAPAKLAVLEPFALSTNGAAQTVHLKMRLTFMAEMYDYLPQAQS